MRTTVGLLFVCTGNTCRSAVAEHLATRWLGPGIPVSSAGLGASPGERLHPFSEAALAAFGVQVTDFAARRVDGDTVAQADLVLTMTVEHREDVLRLAPRHLRRTFTLPEAALLSGAVDPTPLAALPWPERLSTLAALMDNARAARTRGRPAPGDDDIADPIGGDRRVHVDAAAVVATNVRRITDTLLGRPAEVTVVMGTRPPVPARTGAHRG